MMKRVEIRKILGVIGRSELKSKKLRTEADSLRLDAQKQLDSLAKSACPYKKGDIFKKDGVIVWAIMTGVFAHDLRHGLPGEKYASAPYNLECRRCNKQQIVDKTKIIIIYGEEIGTRWKLLKELP